MTDDNQDETAEAGVVKQLRASHIDIGVVEGDGDDVAVKAGSDVLLLSRGEAHTLADEIKRKL